MLFPLAVFGPLDWGVVGLYFALMIYMGVVAARKDQDSREYFLAHRSIPSWAVAISIVATSLSAATFVGVPDEAYKGNLGYLVLSLGSIVAVIIVTTLFVPKLYRAGTVTIYGYLNQRFGEGAMIAVSIMFLIGRMLASGARLFIAAIPLCLLMFAHRGDAHFNATKGQLIFSICLIGLVGTFYTSFGGIRTVIWIDVIQFFIVVGAAVLSIGMLLHAIPLPLGKVVHLLSQPGTGPHGHSKLFFLDTSHDLSLPYTVWAALFGYSFLNTAAYGVDQDLAQRFLVAKSAWRGALSVAAAQIIAIATSFLFLVIGLLLWVFYQRPDVMGAAAPTDMPGNNGAYPSFLLNQLPTVLSGIAIAGFFAIAQGSMDSAINALASSAVADIYYPLRRRWGHDVNRREDKAIPKLAVALMGALMSGLGIVCILIFQKGDTLVQFALGVLNFAFTGMLAVFLTALLTRRGNTASVIAALVTGVVSVVLMQPRIMDWWTHPLLGHSKHIANTWWTPIGTILAFAVCVSGSPVARPAAVTAQRPLQVT